MKRYLVIIEKNSAGWGAYVPDLPGCITIGDSREEVEELIYEAIEGHLEIMHENGEEIPEPASEGVMIGLKDKVA
jgi:predicted RNase H-like HicB family nuclease